MPVTTASDLLPRISRGDTTIKPQEILEAVMHHLWTQRHVSTENGMCVYLASDGRRCGIGALFPDDFYDPLMDVTHNGGVYIPASSLFGGTELELRGVKITPVRRRVRKVFNGLPDGFIDWVQAIHDDANYDEESGWSEDAINWPVTKAVAQRAADRYGLNTKFLADLPDWSDEE